MVLCLVDGDGNIFSPELISAGHTGGAQAALLLNRGIMEDLKTFKEIPTKNPQIWLTIYCNLNGLRDVFVNHQHCTVEQYDAFIEGFNKAAPLFSIVDVGSSKEAADTKLKGLNLSLPLPLSLPFLHITDGSIGQNLFVFSHVSHKLLKYTLVVGDLFSFLNDDLTACSGLHDNGYTTTLSHLQTEGLLDKLVFLRGYNEIAFQLRDYEIPECTVPGVFMTQKMPLKLNPRRFAQGFHQAYSSPSQPQPNLPFPQFQSNPSFASPQPSPPFSPPMPAALPFQPRSTPTSPVYTPQAMPLPSPALYPDPTLVRAFSCRSIRG